MIEHWNLFPSELQLFHPNPSEFVILKIDLVNTILQFLPTIPKTDHLVEEINACLDMAAALLDKGNIIYSFNIRIKLSGFPTTNQSL